MANFSTLLREQIVKLSRKATKSEIENISKKIAEQRKCILQLRKTIRDLEKKMESISRSLGKKAAVPQAPKEVLEKSRLSGGLIRKLRKRLGISRKDFGKLVGVKQSSIYLWENGKNEPRNAAKARLIQLRKIGKRQLKKLLVQKPV